MEFAFLQLSAFVIRVERSCKKKQEELFEIFPYICQDQPIDF